jgi:hypothetical protein
MVMTYNGMVKDIETQGLSISVARAQEIKPMSVEEQIRSIAKEKNFQWTSYLLKLAKCESQFNPLALNNNGQHGIDRGVFQINTKYHPEVSNECAFSTKCATEWTIKRINEGHQNEWVCDGIVLKK